MSYYEYFESREKAGIILAEELKKIGVTKPVLLAIPRGGIQIAEAIAERFEVPINVIISKKLPLPMNPEVAFGAMTEDQINIINEDMVKNYRISESEIKEISEIVNREIKHRLDVYGRFDEKEITSADAVIIDDGVATGSSLIAAIERIKSMNPAKLIVAVPVSTASAYERIKPTVDEYISPIVDDTPFFAVSTYYKKWTDLSEQEIIEILKKYRNLYS